MPITSKIKGDLLALAEKGKFHVIVHGANCQGIMGAGIAGQIAKKYPQVLDADRAYHIPVGYIEREGNFSSCNINYHDYYDELNHFTIINAYTQYLTGANASRVSIYGCFKGINDSLKLLQDYLGYPLTVGIPAIGCGIGGLKWEDVESVINLATPNIDITYVEYNND